MSAAINLQVCEVATRMLSRECTLLHVDDRQVVLLLFLLLFRKSVVESLDEAALVRTV